MRSLLNTSSRVAGALLAAALLLPAQTQARIARPGTVNYTEGIVSLNGQRVTERQVGSIEVATGQVLETQDGKAEMLLTPGVFLRLGDHSAVRMVSPSITDTRVELVRGTAMVEAAQVLKENHLAVADQGSETLIQKHGIYSFNANQPAVAVFDGEAQVREEDRTAELHKGHEVALGPNNPKLKTESFNVKKAEESDPLYAWSKLRSEYVAEANMSLAQTVYVSSPNWWYGTGWYWNPYFDSFAFMPGFGYLDSPFGWGFYSPVYWGGYIAPYYGFGRYPIYPGRIHAFTGGRGFAGAPAFRAPAAAGGGVRGFSGGVRGFGGGMHMGGGGMRMGGGRR